MALKIIHEDQHIIVVEKPPKIPSQRDKTGDKDMLTYIGEYLQSKYPETKNPYVGLIQRLDRPVGGVMVFAKTKYANQKLSEQIRLNKMCKVYYAVVCGVPDKEEDTLVDYLKKLSSVNMSKVVPAGTANAKEAILDYQVLETVETKEHGVLTLIKVNLQTGRHHQIRVQLANANLPLWGDNKYNQTFVKQKEWTQIALWAGILTLEHPKTNKNYTFKILPKEQYPYSLFQKF
ncbi:RNA pseudouridine synthase [Mobilitalea sibirica]|uniref:RNA pseudouridylate synthase n=1 Tax=Mobilitalea sibirica TaxID=1462919 RepID=A0A8J7H2V1_9FIRM|nr:RNA pseudouridine synthase [Mobilitalea sibirica]MBH1940965.1 RNA pseudouridine synthase [Mobilitalea sibirica]